jgi:glutaredoxin 3
MSETPEVRVYTTRFCGYCVAAKRLLAAESIPYREIRVDDDHEARMRLVQASGGVRTVPQVFVGEVHVGGYDDLARMHRSGTLEPLLEEQGITRA